MIALPERNTDGSYTSARAGMAIDADGANGQSSAPVYAPAGIAALDYLANAGGPGNWYGIVTDAKGRPYIQRPEDPAPGAYVSATSYMHKGYSRRDPRAYVDSNAVVYIVLPSHWRMKAKGVVLGCRAEVRDVKTGKTIPAAVLDFGPKAKIGEASIACAREFGVPISPKHGGTEEKRFIYTFWPGQPGVVNGFAYDLQPA